MRKLVPLVLSIGLSFLMVNDARAYFTTSQQSCGSWVINQQQNNLVAQEQEDWVFGFLAGVDAGARAQSSEDFSVVIQRTPIFEETELVGNDFKDINSKVLKVDNKYNVKVVSVKNSILNTRIRAISDTLMKYISRPSVTKNQSDPYGVILSITNYCKKHPTQDIRESASIYYLKHDPILDHGFNLF